VPQERANAVVGWGAVGLAVAIAAWIALAGTLLWSGFALVVAVLTALPALWTRDWTTLVPWPLPVAFALALVVGAFSQYREVAGYLAVAAAAITVVVELDAFTQVELDRRFAVGFGVLTTMATQALWIVAQFVSDRWLGTDFLTTQTELQWDIVAVTVVGFALGGLYYWYVTRVGPTGATDAADRAGQR